MKLLLDENLSRRVIPFILSEYPGSTQIALLGMEQSDDKKVWNYAKQNDFVIVTQDSDYLELSSLHGQPPKVIFLRTGNQSKAAIITLLLKAKESLETVLLQGKKAYIEIF